MVNRLVKLTGAATIAVSYPLAGVEGVVAASIGLAVGWILGVTAVAEVEGDAE